MTFCVGACAAARTGAAGTGAASTSSGTDVAIAFGIARASLLAPSAAASTIEAAGSNAAGASFFSSSRSFSPTLPGGLPEGETAGIVTGFATAANSASKPSAAGVSFADFAKP
jgi:hypothetical protein